MAAGFGAAKACEGTAFIGSPFSIVGEHQSAGSRFFPLSLHLIFTRGAFNREVPFDPNMYFFGDEVIAGARAFTCGYDLYHPHVIVGWHCYDRRSRTPHWDDHPAWRRQHSHSLDRMRRLLLGRTRSRYGLGRLRTLAEYEDRIFLKLVDDPS